MRLSRQAWLAIAGLAAVVVVIAAVIAMGGDDDAATIAIERRSSAGGSATGAAASAEPAPAPSTTSTTTTPPATTTTGVPPVAPARSQASSTTTVRPATRPAPRPASTSAPTTSTTAAPTTATTAAPTPTTTTAPPSSGERFGPPPDAGIAHERVGPAGQPSLAVSATHAIWTDGCANGEARYEVRGGPDEDGDGLPDEQLATGAFQRTDGEGDRARYDGVVPAVGRPGEEARVYVHLECNTAAMEFWFDIAFHA